MECLPFLSLPAGVEDEFQMELSVLFSVSKFSQSKTSCLRIISIDRKWRVAALKLPEKAGCCFKAA